MCSVVHLNGTLNREHEAAGVRLSGLVQQREDGPKAQPDGRQGHKDDQDDAFILYGGTGAHFGRGCPLRHAEHGDEIDPEEGVTRDGKMHGQVEHPGQGPD